MRGAAFQRRRASAGFSLIETFLAMALLTFGLLGIASLRVVSIRSKNFAKNMETASSLAHDLSENMERWRYTDSRLAMISTVTSGTDPAVLAHWDMGRATTVTSSAKAEFAEAALDGNATTSSALGTTYMGLASPTGFNRYWNVFGLDIAGTGTAQAKLVQIIVRWFEPGLGERQVAFSTTVVDPSALYQ